MLSRKLQNQGGSFFIVKNFPLCFWLWLLFFYCPICLWVVLSCHRQSQIREQHHHKLKREGGGGESSSIISIHTHDIWPISNVWRACWLEFNSIGAKRNDTRIPLFSSFKTMRYLIYITNPRCIKIGIPPISVDGFGRLFLPSHQSWFLSSDHHAVKNGWSTVAALLMSPSLMAHFWVNLCKKEKFSSLFCWKLEARAWARRR